MDNPFLADWLMPYAKRDCSMMTAPSMVRCIASVMSSFHIGWNGCKSIKHLGRTAIVLRGVDDSVNGHLYVTGTCFSGSSVKLFLSVRIISERLNRIINGM